MENSDLSVPEAVRKVKKNHSVLRETNPLLELRQKDNRPYLTVQVGGSSSIHLLRKMNLGLHYDVSVNLTTADGKPQNTLGYVNLPISLNEVTKVLRVLVVPSITHDLILGMDFIHDFNLTLDFRDFSYGSSCLSSDNSVAVVRAILGSDSLTEPQKYELDFIIDLFKQIAPSDRLGRTHLYRHHIDTGDAKPVRQRQYPLSPAMQKVLNVEIDKMLELNIIKPISGCSPWLSPLWCA
ncbi:uncharacterized protein LOC123686681 isoform X1 [Harmonia axyridis]|uniref:uncharacterized protein LOC123686681 isoform X1 n=1 Tax=Harmonia axyridis TaxID=115357 RepID=UPI001E2755B1|nr:uncharacterized protein LOC123686681 isoform X1 [Harmonia axyridis]